MADTAYTIRPFPQDLHRKAKALAALEGITLKEFILNALSEYVAKKQEHVAGGKPTLEQLLGKCEQDMKRIIGESVAKSLGKWRENEGNYLRLIPFVQWRLRAANKETVRKLEREGGLSLERIALDYYPEFFNASDLHEARKTLGIDGEKNNTGTKKNLR
jgi:hypothetical protein